MNPLTPSFVAQADLDKWYALYASDRAAAQKHNFEVVLPGVIEYLRGLPEHRELPEQRCSTLVSLMGFSPETTVIATALLRPKRLVILYSEKTAESVELAGPFLTSRKLVSFTGLAHRDVDPTNPNDIYEKVAAALSEGDDARNIIDVTGGKKVMSSMAAVVAAELDLPICYINGEFDEQLRRPTPGTERLMLLSTHGRLSAMHKRERALDRYEAFDYPAAIPAFAASRDAQSHNAQLDEFALALCHVYAAWVDLDLASLARRLDAFDELSARQSQQLVCRGIPGLAGHLEALRQVAAGEDTALLATFIELSQRYAKRGRHDFACLLAYRSMESVLQLGMRRATAGRFNFARPDYALLGESAEVVRRYVDLSKSLGGEVRSELPAKITLLDGFLLLGAVDGELLQRIGTGRPLKSFGGWLRQEASKRNDSVLAHGTTNLGAEDYRGMIDLASRLAEAVLGAGHERMLELRERLQPRDLRQSVFAKIAHAEGRR